MTVKSTTKDWRTIVGPTPELSAGDVVAATRFWRKILVAQQRGGWTHAGWVRLDIMERRWRKRATGVDARFMVVGTRRGGLTKHEQADVTVVEFNVRNGGGIG